MEEIESIKWLRNLELSPKEKYRGETGFMIHGIIHALVEYRALKRVLEDKGIKITPKELGKYN